MGTVPTPPTFTAGAVLTAAQQNGLRDAINFLIGPPRCQAYQQTGTTTLTNNTYTPLALDGKLFDVVQSGDSPSHDNATNNTRVYARTAGKYRISGEVTFAANATGQRLAQIRLNANSSPSAGTQLTEQGQGNLGAGMGVGVPIPTFLYPLTAGDYIEIFGYQNSGGSLATQIGSGKTFLSIEWAGL